MADVEDASVDASDETMNYSQITQTSAEEKIPHDSTPLDLAFCVDCTGSMGSYITSVQQNIVSINEKLKNHFSDIRYGLVCYRDHPPQDRTYVSKVFDFKTNVEEAKKDVQTMSASGGGDAPESLCCALYDSLNMKWRSFALKILIVITDAPPHGLCSGMGDGFPHGCPLKRDPLDICRKIKNKGVILYSVLCQPSLGYYPYAVDFYAAIAQVTGGCAVPLGNAQHLPTLIMGSAQQEHSLRVLTDDIASMEREIGSQSEISRSEMAHRITTTLQSKKTKTTQLKFSKQVDAPNAWLFVRNGSLEGATLEVSQVGAQSVADTSTADVGIVSAEITEDQVLRVLERIPQTLPLPKQIKNPQGGYSFKVDDMTRLRRFLCIGSEGGSYSVDEAKMTIQNALAVERLLKNGRGKEVVDTVLDYSVEGKTAKQNPLLFAYAMCCKIGDVETRKYAYSCLEKICRIPTHLFAFIEYCQELIPNTTGWGRAHRRAVAKWYLNKKANELAFAVTKYKNRNGWTHTDVLRLCHPHPESDEQRLVFKYIAKGWEEAKKYYQEIDTNAKKENSESPQVPQGKGNKGGKSNNNNKSLLEQTYELLTAVEFVSHQTDYSKELKKAILDHRLAREHLPTPLLGRKDIWIFLLDSMPLTATIRNLNKMTQLEVLTSTSTETKRLVERLNNLEELKKAKIHPLNVLFAMKVYNQGKGDKGSLTWTPVPEISQALESAFYLSFKAIEPTGKRHLLAVDVSGSMNVKIANSCVSCLEAALAMSLVTLRTEPEVVLQGFSGNMVPLKGITKESTLNDALEEAKKVPLGPTDCAAPMVWALNNRVPVDVFVIYTDSETFVGGAHPKQALDNYRKAMDIEAKLVVVGMTATEFSLADPSDAGMLDIAGFDTGAPEVMRNFILGLI